MKIAVNTRFLLPDRLEGMGLFTHEVLRRMVKDHPQHTFLFFFDRPFDEQFVYGDNVKPIVLFPPARHPFLFIWWFEWSLPRAFNKYKPDVFLSTDNFLSLRTDVKTVLVTHDIAHVHYPDQLPFFHREYYRIFAPRFNRKADRIVTVSEFTKQDLVAQYGIDPGRIDVACNGCPPGFRPLTEEKKKEVRDAYSDGEPYFFYVGAVHPRKNLGRLISAFDRFKKATGSPAKLLIAGRIAWKAGEAGSAIQKSSCASDIHLLGYVPDEVLAELTGSALALAYVSLFEGFGIPILQAMHCDVPVITSTVSSMPEVAGEAGLLVNPGSVEEIAGAMQQIWEDKHLRSNLVVRGREQRTRFSWRRATDIVYQNLLKAVQ